MKASPSRDDQLVTADAAGTIRVWDACTACGNAGALLAIARNRVTRQLTSLERATFLGGKGHQTMRMGPDGLQTARIFVTRPHHRGSGFVRSGPAASSPSRK